MPNVGGIRERYVPPEAMGAYDKIDEITRTTRHLVNVTATQLSQLQLLIAKMDQVMAELDDLKSAVTALTSEVSAAADEIKAETDKILQLLASGTGVDPAAVEAAANTVKGLADQLHSAVSDAQAALPPTTP